MTRSIPLLAALALAGCLAGDIHAETYGDDFERTYPDMDGHGPEGKAKAILTIVKDSPDGGDGRSLRIAWAGTHGTHVDAGYGTSPRTLPPMTPARSVTVRMDAKVTGGNVRMIAVRLVDDHGETFQWRKALDPQASGWQHVVIPIDVARHHGNWGPKDQVDGIAELPLRLVGYAIVLDAEKPQEGSILIDHVTIEQTP